MDAQVTFHIAETLCGGALDNGTVQGRLSSPGFPNLYPLNAACAWTVPLAAPVPPGRALLLDLPTLDLAPGHSISVTEQVNATTRTHARYNSSSSDMPSLLYRSNATNTITFAAPTNANAPLAAQVGQGFQMDFWVLKCGESLSANRSSLTSPGFPSPLSCANATLCAWVISLAPNATGGGVNIISLTVNVTGAPNGSESVRVLDGPNLRSPLLTFDPKGSNSSLSRRNTVLVVFNTSALAAGQAVALNLTYAIYTCNASSLCDNKICMQPGWRCNGQNDCGDESDEKNCVYPPPPPTTPAPPAPGPQEGKSGVGASVAALVFFVGVGLGVLGAVLLPRIVRRTRAQRYARFDSDTPVA